MILMIVITMMIMITGAGARRRPPVAVDVAPVAVAKPATGNNNTNVINMIMTMVIQTHCDNNGNDKHGGYMYVVCIGDCRAAASGAGGPQRALREPPRVVEVRAVSAGLCDIDSFALSLSSSLLSSLSLLLVLVLALLRRQATL